MPIRIILAAGLTSAGLFIMAAVSGLGLLFFFLPTLPLIMLGMSGPPKYAFYAALLGAAALSLGASPEPALLYLLFLAIPACLLAKDTLMSRFQGGGHEWLPAGIVLTRLALYGCALNILIGLYYANQGGIANAMEAQIRQALSAMPQDYAAEAELLAERWSFMVFAASLWLWCLAFYAHGWLAARILALRQNSIRPGFGLAPFAMPNWMATLLLLCAAASLAGGETMVFLGKATLVSLLFPYFLLGLALTHRASLRWPGRNFSLFFIYLLMSSLVWPVLIFSALGLWEHMKRLSGVVISDR